MRLDNNTFSNAKLLVVGDLMLDRYWAGPTSRISPEAPVPVVRIDDQACRPGGAGNVAINMTALGAAVKLQGFVGDDEAGAALTTALIEHGVDSALEQAEQFSTITKLRIMSRHQQLIRLDFEQPRDDLPSADLLAKFERYVADCDVVILSDYAKGALNCANALIKLAKAANKPVLVDPKGDDFSRYQGATLLTPNLLEFEGMMGRCRDDADLVAKGEQLREQLALDALLITRGGQGMTLIQNGQPALHLEAKAREVFDVTGAGDTVISILALAMAVGRPIVAAAQLANLAAGIVVGKLGAVPVTIDELSLSVDEFLNAHETDQRVMSGEQLITCVKAAKAAGETIVVTNGCFDILHAGHIRYLEAAAALGDRLIVLVNDDASVARLKGESRPINTLSDRMCVLGGLQSVDWVAPFSEDTPQRMMAALLPDLLVKGGDYEPQAIAGFDEVVAAGGEVRVLNFETGYSTSSVVERIKEGE